MLPFHFFHMGLLLLQPYCQLPDLILQFRILSTSSSHTIVPQAHFQVNVVVVLTATRRRGCLGNRP